jgi:hypothetical protein
MLLKVNQVSRYKYLPNILADEVLKSPALCGILCSCSIVSAIELFLCCEGPRFLLLDNDLENRSENNIQLIKAGDTGRIVHAFYVEKWVCPFHF